MPHVKPLRQVGKVKCVKKFRDKNGDIQHDLKVLFDYVSDSNKRRIRMHSLVLALLDLS